MPTVWELSFAQSKLLLALSCNLYHKNSLNNICTPFIVTRKESVKSFRSVIMNKAAKAHRGKEFHRTLSVRKRRIDTLESMYGANATNIAVSGGITYENFIKLNIDDKNALYTILGNT